ncbi:MAG: T9SS type A sorting domain-containing protein, partial [Elusimicrobia bacterium]|nr:T9SS type A sorting domain-containing protein [Elusimicrobiota bacterium]
LGTSSITWTWNAVTGAESYQVFSAAGEAVSPVLPSTAVSFTETGLAADTPYARYVKAANRVSGASSDGLTVRTAAGNLTRVFDVDSNAKDLSFVLPNGTRVSLDIPAGAFSEAMAVTMTSVLGETLPWGNSLNQRLKGTNVAVNISIGNSAQPAKDVELTLSYSDADVAGLDETKLVIARYDPASGLWIPLSGTVDPANNKVTGKTGHFSLFQVMERAASASVSSAKAYPVPFRPAKGHTHVTFSLLPANASVRIYTEDMSEVRELTADGLGSAVWDGKNASGEAVASGVYVCQIQGEGGKKTLRVVVQR